MRQIIKYLRQILNFDYRNVQWWQWVIGIAGVVVAIWILGIVLGLITRLVAPALVLIALYFGYRMVNSREPVEASNQQANSSAVAATTTNSETQATTIEVTQEQPIEVEIEAETEAQEAQEEAEREEKATTRLSLAEETMMETERIMGQLEARKKRIQKQMDDK